MCVCWVLAVQLSGTGGGSDQELPEWPLRRARGVLGLMWSRAGALGAPAALQNGVGASHKVLLASRAVCWKDRMSCAKHRQPGRALGV